MKEIRGCTQIDAEDWYTRYINTSAYKLVELHRHEYVKPTAERAALELHNDEDVMDQGDEKKMILALVAQYEQDRKPGVVKEDPRKPFVVTSMQVPVEHSKLIEEFVLKYDPATTTDTEILKAFVKLLPAIGSSKRAMLDMERLMHEYEIMHQTNDAWKEEIRRYSRSNPFAFCLIDCLHATVEAWRGVQTFPLPVNVAEQQIRVLQQRLGLKSNDLDIERACIWLCACCHTINSPIQSHSGVQRQNKIEGKQHIRYDVELDEIFCRRGKVIGHRACDTQAAPNEVQPLVQPLVQVNDIFLILLSCDVFSLVGHASRPLWAVFWTRTCLVLSTNMRASYAR
jgi:hypothetical protein